MEIGHAPLRCHELIFKDCNVAAKLLGMQQTPLSGVLLVSVILGGCPARSGFNDVTHDPGDQLSSQTGDGDSSGGDGSGDIDTAGDGDGDGVPGGGDSAQTFRFQYDRTWIVLLRNAAMLPLTPENTQNAGSTSYQVAPPLPAGLSLNPTTGAISGTPSALQAPFSTHTVTATASIGSSVAQLRIAVLDGFIVDTTSDVPPAGVLGDGICSNTSSSCSIRAAAAEAAALTGPQAIMVPSGSYLIDSVISFGSDALIGSRGGTTRIDASATTGVLSIVSPDVGYLSDLEIGEAQDPGGNGGCIDMRGQIMASNIYVHDCLANTGGGIKIYNGGSLDVEASRFTNNHAEGFGGAIAATDSSLLIARTTTFSDNRAEERGGAVYLESDVLNTLRASYLGDNTGAQGGGGVYLSGNGRISIETCTFERNSAGSANGGAIMSDGVGLDISYSTFGNNLAGGTGTVVAVPNGQNTAVMRGCLLFDESAPCSTGTTNFVSNGYNVFDGPLTACPELSATTDIVDAFLGSGFLGTAANNGGPTFTVAIPRDSDATDIGDLTCPTRDQRGERRPQSLDSQNSCDAGAYEISSTEVF